MVTSRPKSQRSNKSQPSESPAQADTGEAGAAQAAAAAEVTDAAVSAAAAQAGGAEATATAAAGAGAEADPRTDAGVAAETGASLATTAGAQAQLTPSAVSPAHLAAAATSDTGAQLAAALVDAGAHLPAAAATADAGPRTLAIDIGGSGIKVMLLAPDGAPMGERRRVETPRPATPDAVLAAIESLLPEEHYDRVSVGFPGVVVDGVVRTAPNLAPAFAGFDLQREITQRTGRPTRVLNDAGVQGHGVVEGRGVEMLLTLGTGMGCALFIDGRYVPNVELAHHPFRKSKTYEEYVSDHARRRIGNRRWRQRVRRVVRQVLLVFNPRVLYLGGGNARRLRFSSDEIEGVRVTDNVAGLLGGFALWR